MTKTDLIFKTIGIKPTEEQKDIITTLVESYEVNVHDPRQKAIEICCYLELDGNIHCEDIYDVLIGKLEL